MPRETPLSYDHLAINHAFWNPSLLWSPNNQSIMPLETPLCYDHLTIINHASWNPSLLWPSNNQSIMPPNNQLIMPLEAPLCYDHLTINQQWSQRKGGHSVALRNLICIFLQVNFTHARVWGRITMNFSGGLQAAEEGYRVYRMFRLNNWNELNESHIFHVVFVACTALTITKNWVILWNVWTSVVAQPIKVLGTESVFLANSK